MTLRLLLPTLLLPLSAHAAASPPCARGTEPALRGCLATLCRAPATDRTPPRVREAGWRVLGCEPPRPRVAGKVVTGQYALYRPDGAAGFTLATVISSFARTPDLDTTMSFDGGPFDAAGTAMLRVDATTRMTFPNRRPGRDGTVVTTNVDAWLCPTAPEPAPRCQSLRLERSEAFTPAGRGTEPLRTHETYRLDLGPGSFDTIGPLERLPPRPRGEDTCPSGTLQEVVDCLQPRCPAAVRDVTPWGLDRAGWYLVQCDFAADDPPDDLPGDPTGEVRLYRAANHHLAYATTLTTLGHAAKRVEDTPMEVNAWQLASVGTRRALRLEWTRSEPARDAEDTADLTIDTRAVTVCLEDGACASVPGVMTQTTMPHAGGPPLVTEQRFEVTTDDEGLVVRGPLGAAEASVQRVPLGP